MTTKQQDLSATPENVKRLRDEEGVTWNGIGEMLGLDPDYKKRAHKARQLYKQASGGALPPSSRAVRTPKEPGVKPERKARASKSSRKTGGIPIRVPEGDVAKHLLSLDDEAVLDMLRGKQVRWRIRIGPDGAILKPADDTPEGSNIMEMQARVGPRTASIQESTSGNRTLCFNEPDYGSRALYLAAIYDILS